MSTDMASVRGQKNEINQKQSIALKCD